MMLGVHPEQYQLFDLGPIDFASLKQTRERIMLASKAPNTLRAYASAWKIFREWCEQAGRQPLPASPDTILDFAAQTLRNELRLETVRIRLKAISYQHREEKLDTPTGHPSVRQFLRNAARDLKEEPRGKMPVTPEHVLRIAQLECSKPAQVRNLAMLLLAFNCGWRRSEIVALDRRDIQFAPKGILLWQGRSKTDQKGEGRYVGVHFAKPDVICPVRALRAWVALRGEWQGPLFTCIGPGGKAILRERLESRNDTLYNAIKAWMRRIGENPKLYGGHSTRAGMVTASSEAGATTAAIKRCTGHKCTKTVERYIRIPEAFGSNPMEGVWRNL